MLQFEYLNKTIHILEQFIAKYGGEIIPCTSEEVEKLESMLPHPYCLPTAYKEFMLYGGKKIGKLFDAFSFSYDMALLHAENGYSEASSMIKIYDRSAEIPDDIFVLTTHITSYFDYFRLSEGENPPVYSWSDDEELGIGAIEKPYEHFTDFLINQVRLRHLELIPYEMKKRLEEGNPPRGRQFWLSLPSEKKEGINYESMMDYFGFFGYDKIEKAAATFELDSYSYLEELSGWKARQVGDEIRFFPPSYKSPEEKALELQNQLESKKQELAKVEKIIANLTNRIKNLSGGKLTGGRSINFNNSSALRIKELELDLRKQKVNKQKLEKEIDKLERNSN